MDDWHISLKNIVEWRLSLKRTAHMLRGYGYSYRNVQQEYWCYGWKRVYQNLILLQVNGEKEVSYCLFELGQYLKRKKPKGASAHTHPHLNWQNGKVGNSKNPKDERLDRFASFLQINL